MSWSGSDPTCFDMEYPTYLHYIHQHTNNIFKTHLLQVPPVMKNPQLSPQTKSAKNKPAYMQIKKSLRNSFRRGSSFFRLEKSPPKSKTTGESFKSLASPMMIKQSNPNIIRIKNQIAHQEAIREQLVAAIEICRRSLECSSELIEAERLMLLFLKKKSNANSELIRIDYDNEDHSENFNVGSATVDIRRLEFPLNRSDMTGTSKFYYVCLCSCRDRVMATYALERCTNDDKIVFKDMKMSFSHLDRQFEIKVELFMLRLPSLAQPKSPSSRKVSSILCLL